MSKVAVVIPAYNPGPLLHRALNSVVDQTFTDWEAIVVDDGSNEDLSWVEHLDPRVRLLSQTNSGVSRARNVGVALTTAPLVAFLDQDDEWLPDKLEEQIRAMAREPDAPFSYTEFVWVFPSSETPGAYPENVSYRGLLTDQHVVLSSVIIRRAAYFAAGGHDPMLSMMQDYDLFLRLMLDGQHPVCVHAPLVRYHLHNANASSDFETSYREKRLILEVHRARARRRGDAATERATGAGVQRARSLYSEQAFQAFRAAKQSGDVMTGLVHLRSAFVWSPAQTIRSITHGVRAKLLRADIQA